jgi:hypothetical protein
METLLFLLRLQERVYVNIKLHERMMWLHCINKIILQIQNKHPLKAFYAGVARKGYIAKIAYMETTLCWGCKNEFILLVYGKYIILRLLVRFATTDTNSLETMLCWSLQERVNIANAISMETLLCLGLNKRVTINEIKQTMESILCMRLQKRGKKWLKNPKGYQKP